jgi:hypothetical protein
MKPFVKTALGTAACLAVAGIAYAAVILDDDGIGFVGKGDVQLVYGWNNKQLQDNAGLVQFQAVSDVVTEVSWTCTNSNNQNEQIRARTTTTSIEGILSSVARVRNQITGFNLNGWVGAPTVDVDGPDGPPLNSCPSGPWTLTTPAGDPVVVSATDSVEVSIDGTDWYALLVE